MTFEQTQYVGAMLFRTFAFLLGLGFFTWKWNQKKQPKKNGKVDLLQELKNERQITTKTQG